MDSIGLVCTERRERDGGASTGLLWCFALCFAGDATTACRHMIEHSSASRISEQRLDTKIENSLMPATHTTNKSVLGSDAVGPLFRLAHARPFVPWG